jgi:hypothetical protein
LAHVETRVCTSAEAVHSPQHPCRHVHSQSHLELERQLLVMAAPTEALRRYYAHYFAAYLVGDQRACRAVGDVAAAALETDCAQRWSCTVPLSAATV